MQLSAPEPTPRARINWILEKETLGKTEVVLKSWRGGGRQGFGNGEGDWRRNAEGTEGGAFKVRGGESKRQQEMIAAITAIFKHAFALI